VIYYISDLHLGHEKVIHMDNRPFDNAFEMQEKIIRNWNSVVTGKDTVYSLGDMFWKPSIAEQILPRLNGSIVLIRGNHDRINDNIKNLYSDIYHYLEVNDDSRRVILCHYPIAHWNAQHRGAIHLYGHIHNNRENRPFQLYAKMCREEGIPFECYNVGCMLSYMDYTPRTLDYIRKVAKY